MLFVISKKIKSEKIQSKYRKENVFSSWSRRSFQQDILRNCQLRFEKCHFIWFAIEIENYLYWENIVKTLMINTIQKLFDIEV